MDNAKPSPVPPYEATLQIIDTEKLYPFEKNPFEVRPESADMKNLIESISINGLLVPLIVRAGQDDRYEILSGHRRAYALKVLNIPAARAYVCGSGLSSEQAALIVCDSNMFRTDIRPSEYARMYKLRLESIKSVMKLSGKERYLSVESLARSADVSREQIRRYIRLNELIPELLERVDDGKLGFRTAVELSYLPREGQQLVLDAMLFYETVPSLAQAIEFKSLSRSARLERDTVYEILNSLKPNQKEKDRLSVSPRVRELVPESVPDKDIEDFLIRCITEYTKQHSF